MRYSQSPACSLVPIQQHMMYWCADFVAFSTLAVTFDANGIIRMILYYGTLGDDVECPRTRWVGGRLPRLCMCQSCLSRGRAYQSGALWILVLNCDRRTCRWSISVQDATIFPTPSWLGFRAIKYGGLFVFGVPRRLDAKALRVDVSPCCYNTSGP